MSTASTEFDLQPDPRILPMLGEINLAQWRCLAELVDNAVDGFLSVLREGGSLTDPEVLVNLPTRDDGSARVTVADNGPGMTADRLEKAVRAGWSGNSPIDSLGMFGHGLADEAVATAAEAEAFLGWARSLQGWEEERKPLIVEELSFTWRDVRRGHRDLYDETESGRLVLTSFGARVVDALSALDECGLDWYSGWL